MRARTRVLLFAIVGVLGLGCQLGVLQALALGGVPVGLATAFAVATAIGHNFAWHRRLTWRDRSGPWAAQLLRFAGLNGAVSLAGNVLVTIALHGAGLPLPVANLGAVAACGVANFVLADRAVFAAGRGETPHGLRDHGERARCPPSHEDSGACPLRSVPRTETRLRDLAARGCRHGLPAAVWLTAMAAPSGLEAAVLSQATIRSWDEYVAATETRIVREEPSPGAPALSSEQWRRLRAGELLMAQRRTARSDGRAIEIVDGSVHHWVGRVFIPNARVPSIIAALRGPHWRRWSPSEVRSMRIRPGPDGLRVSMRVARESIVDVTYDIEHRVAFALHPAGHATSRSVATRIVEVDDAGTAAERHRPVGDDLGFLWRLNAYWRYLPVEGGVLVECESLALSRGVPAIVRGLAGPLITRVSRESLSGTLLAMRKGFMVTSATADTR